MYRVETKVMVDVIDGVPIFEWWPQPREWRVKDAAEQFAARLRRDTGRSVVVVERNGKEERVL